jgi:hypothetical protein
MSLSLLQIASFSSSSSCSRSSHLQPTPPPFPPARPQALTALGGSPSLPCINRLCCSLLLLLHAKFILHATTKIINLALGRASFGPTQMAGLDPARPPFFKKKFKKFQKSF